MRIVVFVLMLSVGKLNAQDASGANSQLKVMLEQIAKLQVYLEYLRKGYKIVHQGLTTIGEIKKGDLNLHQFFFDRLKAVNPVIRNYYKTVDIMIRYQQVQESVQSYTKEFSQSGLLTGKEQAALTQVFNIIISRMGEEVARLEQVLTDQSLAMSDAERLVQIDMIHTDVVALFREYYSVGSWVQTGILQRKSEQQSLKLIEPLY